MASDPICAPASPLLPSAITIVRVSGQGLEARLSSLLRLPEPRQSTLKALAWDGYREKALTLFFPAPTSYTGEDLVEFHLHGNPLLVRRFLEHLGRLGIRLADPGEFTQRALWNGKQNLLEVEATRDLLAAATDTQLRQAQARAGGVPSWIQETRRRIAPWMARAEAVVDYGEEEALSLDLLEMKRDLRGLQAVFHMEQRRGAAARWLRDGIRIVLVGRPNSGKSTLFNALAGEERAIVTDIPGTTRDVLEVRTDWAGLPLLLYDTAGLRETEDPVERLGVARVAPALLEADLILHLIPADDPHPDPALLARLAAFQNKVVELRTFADLAPGGGLRISAATGDLGELAGALQARFLDGLAPDACLGALATARQREILGDLTERLQSLLALEPGCPPELPASVLQGLWGQLARLTGEDRAESSLDEVFSGFCLGK